MKPSLPWSTSFVMYPEKEAGSARRSVLMPPIPKCGDDKAANSLELSPESPFGVFEGMVVCVGHLGRKRTRPSPDTTSPGTIRWYLEDM